MRASVGTAVLLMAGGGVLSFGWERPPDQIERYVDVFDVGLVLIWSGVLVLVMQIVLHRPRARRRTPGYADYPTEEHDVHRPGYPGQTRRLPTVRGDRRR